MSSDDLGKVLKEGQKKTVAGAIILSSLGLGNGYFIKRLIDKIDEIDDTVRVLTVQIEKNTNNYGTSVATLDKRVALIEESRKDLVPRFISIESEVIEDRRILDIMEVRLELLEKRVGLKNLFPKNRKHR